MSDARDPARDAPSPESRAPKSAETFASTPRGVPEPGIDAETVAVPAVVLQLVRCWRCALEAPPASECARCGASLAPEIRQLGPARQSHAHGLLRMLSAYVALLVTSVAFGLFMHFASDDDETPRSLWEITAPEAALAVIWTAIVLVSVAVLARPATLAARSGAVRATTWLLALPVLAIALGVNLGYHELLRRYVGADWFAEGPVVPPSAAALAWAVAAICVQPAVIEELFFRYFALGTLRAYMGDHASVLVSSLMFGVAHLFVPLSVPVLTLVGVVLGYSRIWSRSLLLPMLLHGVHNGVILWLELRESSGE